MHIQPMLNLVTGARRFGDRQPVTAGFVARLGEDLDDITTMQFESQRHHPSVHFGPNTAMAYFGVNGIGKNDR